MKSLRMTAALLAVAAVIFAVSAVGITRGQDSGVEVRIAAQRLPNGRTEFALQQRGEDGTWSDRVLPRLRFFPATIENNRWLYSSPLTVFEPVVVVTSTPIVTRADLVLDGANPDILVEADSPLPVQFRMLASNGVWYDLDSERIFETRPGDTSGSTLYDVYRRFDGAVARTVPDGRWFSQPAGYDAMTLEPLSFVKVQARSVAQDGRVSRWSPSRQIVFAYCRGSSRLVPDIGSNGCWRWYPDSP